MGPLLPILFLALMSPSMEVSAEECQEESETVPGEMVTITDCTRLVMVNDINERLTLMLCSNILDDFRTLIQGDTSR